jgi:hypothetical protein
VDLEEIDEPETAPLRVRLARVLDRAERVYLKLLRAAILIIATGLVIYAVVLAAISLYKISRSPDSVHEDVAAVSANELTSAEAPSTPQPSRPGGMRTNPAQRRAYDRILTQYYQLFRARFEPFRQSDDHALARTEFDNRFLDIQTRLAAVGRGDLNFDDDVADLQTLVNVMSEAAILPATQQRLRRYKAAQRVQSCQNVERTRPTVTLGWDSLSVSCPSWYENGGCAVARTVQTPYTARECSMRFPEGTQSHIQVFRAYQDRFFSLLSQRRTDNATHAQAARDNIIAGNLQGRLSLWTALLILLGFLVLMFFFLLIAIERHQRRLAAERSGD